MLQYDSDKNSWSGLLVDINNVRKGIVDVGVEADTFFNKMSSSKADLSFLNNVDDAGFQRFIKQNELADESLIGFLKDTNYAQKDLASYQLYLKNTGKATSTFATLTKKAGSVLKSFGATLVSMGVSWLAGQALGLVIKGFDNLIHAEERAIELTEELKSKHEELNQELDSHKKLVDDVVDEYKKLSKGVDTATNKNISLSEKDYQSYLDIVNRLGKAFPTLKQTMDENGNAILTLGNNGRDAAEYLRELLNTEEELNNYKISQDIGGLFGGVKEKLKNSDIAEKDYKATKEWYEKIHSILESGIELSSELSTFTFDISNPIDYKAYSAFHNGLEKFYSNLSIERRRQLEQAFNPGNVIGDFNNDGLYESYIYAYLLSDEERTNLENEIKIQMEDILISAQDEFDLVYSKFTSDKIEADVAWADFLPSLVATMKSKGSFKKLADGEFGEDIQAFAIELVSNLDSSVALQMNKKDPYKWVSDNIILPITQLNDSDRKLVVDSYNKLLTLNPQDLSEINQSAIDGFVKTISEALGKNETEIRLILGFNIDEDYKNKFDSAIQNAVDSLGISKSEAEKIFTDLGIDTKEEIDKWNEVTNGINNAEAAINTFVETVKGTLEETTASLSNLKTASESLSTLSSAFKELSDDGYITIETLSKIKEASKLSEDAWAGYENTLLNAEKGSEEFNNALSDLTYVMVREHLGGVESLANANEDYVTALLRENGIADANVSAQRLIAKAKLEHASTIEALSNATEESIKDLFDEIRAYEDLGVAIDELETAYKKAQEAMTSTATKEALKRLGITDAE